MADIICRHLFIFVILVGCGFFSLRMPSQAQTDEAKAIMGKSDCLACHSLNQKLVGPSFKEIASKYQSDKTAPDALVESVVKGSTGKWGPAPMTAHPSLSDSEIRAMVDWILGLASQQANAGDKQEAKKETKPVKRAPASKEEIARGLDLFQGNLRFVNKGPTCISCHHVKNDAVIGGGILAKDLTTVFTRLNEPGVSAILGRPPFPVMEQAYKDQPLTKEEIKALVAFLEYAAKEHFYQQPRDYGLRLFNTGLVGAAFLFGLFGIFGFRRKKKAVAHDIFKRQEKQLGRRN